MTTLSIVQSPGSSVLFAFNDPTGVSNPQGVFVGIRDDELDMGVFDPEYAVQENAGDGASILQVRNSLLQIRFRMKLTGSAQNISDCLGYIGKLLSDGGRYLQFQASGSTDTYYIPFEPSPALQMFAARPLELLLASRSPAVLPEIDVTINRQPWAEGLDVDPAANKVTNATLLHDFGGTANRPDGWAWDSTTGLSAETILADAVNFSYQGTWADAAAHNLQQTTAVGSFASGDVATFSFYARVTSGATSQMQATLQFKQSDGTTNVGGLQSGGLVTLTTSWQRISVTTAAAGALTSRAVLSIQVDNTSAASIVIQMRMAQAEVAATASLFRCGIETVDYDPAGTLPRIALYGAGTAPSLGKVKATSDADGLNLVRLSRESSSTLPIDLLKATLYKQLESGTLGSNTTNTAVSGASASNAAQWTPTASTPAFGTDNSSGGTGATITLTKPTSLAVGELMMVAIWSADATSQLAAVSAGWKLIGNRENTANTFAMTGILFAWYKIADAAAVAATSFVFSRIFPAAPSAASYRGWIGRFTGIDQTNPLMTYAFATENNTTTPTAATITTDAAEAEIVTIFSGNNSAGALNFTAPAGATPTYTEQDDGTADVTYRGMGVYTGNLAAAGATSTKDSTAAIAIDAIMLNVAFRKSPAALAARSTVTFTSLPAGSYHVLLRRYPSAAARMRERVEYQLAASPTTWIPMSAGDFINDVTGASAFTWADRIMGVIVIPPEATLSTLTVRVSVGLELTPAGSPLWNGDFIRLIPCNEHVCVMTCPTTLAVSEILYADAAADKVLHLDTSSALKELGQTAGPTPLEVQPGLQMVDVLTLQAAAAGFTDRSSILGASPTIGVTYRPRYRV